MSCIGFLFLLIALCRFAFGTASIGEVLVIIAIGAILMLIGTGIEKYSTKDE